MSNLFANRLTEKFLKIAKHIRRENSGVAAVEFALILPLMFLLYLGTMEVSIAVSVDRKLSRMAGAIGDLVGQSSATITGAEVEGIFGISSFIMMPYKHTPVVVVSGVQVDPNNANNAVVVWSCASSTSTSSSGQVVNNQLPPGTPADIPAPIRTAGSFIIQTTVSLDYTPIIGFPDPNGTPGVSFKKYSLPLEQETFTQPRLPSSINMVNPGSLCQTASPAT